MIPVLTLAALALLSSAAETGDTTPATPVTPEEWYVGNACVQCHRESGGRLAEIVDDEWAKSVHYENNVPCQNCHGGDASVTRDEFSSDEEFKDVSHLTFNAEFLFLRDRWDVVEGPRQEAVASYTCRECHSWTTERRLGSPHGGLEVSICPFIQYGGVSMPRERGITYICAQCHPRAAEKHVGSTHGSRGAPSCLFCHGDKSHAISSATIDIIDTRPRDQLGKCSLCHKPNTIDLVARIRKTLEETVKLIEVSAEQFQDLQRMGYRNLALGEMHDHVDDMQTNLREVLHGSNIRDINELARSIKHVARRTAYDYELVLALRDARQRQTRIALGTAGLLLVLVAMLVLYMKAFCERPDRAAASPDVDSP